MILCRILCFRWFCWCIFLVQNRFFCITLGWELKFRFLKKTALSYLINKTSAPNIRKKTFSPTSTIIPFSAFQYTIKRREKSNIKSHQPLSTSIKVYKIKIIYAKLKKGKESDSRFFFIS